MVLNIDFASLTKTEVEVLETAFTLAARDLQAAFQEEGGEEAVENYWAEHLALVESLNEAAQAEYAKRFGE